MTISRGLVILVMGVLSLLAADRKVHDWKTGSVEDAAIQKENLGSRTAGSATAGGYGGFGTAAGQASTMNISRTWYGMVIKGDDYGFMVACPMRQVRHLLKLPDLSPPTVTIHGPIKYALEKEGKFFIEDEDGREWKMSVLKKMAIPPPALAK
jgi:hypothetical protein